jgi:16S rRNA C967 or C1407 C5-methylase (RsmB/RsmF family)
MTHAPDLSQLDRYRDLVDDFEAFCAIQHEPLPTVVWANPLLAPVARIEAELRALCPDAQPLGWRSGAWRLPPGTGPGRWPLYQRGWIHAQEEAALLAAPALDPQPGQRLLDLCAAPGNKTAQLAVLSGDRALVFANEVSWQRMAAIRYNLDRLGVTSVALSHHDGRTFPALARPLDGALVDAPCSCEGTLRKARGARRRTADPGFRGAIVATQKTLLRRALTLCRPGATVVYATCTYAPEENEGVVDHVLDLAEVGPLEVPAGLDVQPGITAWGRHTWDGSLARTGRFWPHRTGTGGFYVARLRRL